MYTYIHIYTHNTHTHQHTGVMLDDMWNLIKESETLWVVPNTLHRTIFFCYIFTPNTVLHITYSHIYTQHTHTGVTRDDMWDLVNELETLKVVPNTIHSTLFTYYISHILTHHTHTGVTRDDMWDLVNELETLKVVPNTIHSTLFTYYISHILTHHTHTGVTRDDMWDLIHEFEIMTVVPNTMYVLRIPINTHTSMRGLGDISNLITEFERQWFQTLYMHHKCTYTHVQAWR